MEISIEHEEDYSKNITKLEEMARNRAMVSSDGNESAEDDIGRMSLAQRAPRH